jgi:hypothetical protein
MHLHTRRQLWRLHLVFRLLRDHSVRFPDSAAFVGGSVQGFIGNFRPKLFQRLSCRLVRVPFGIIRTPAPPLLPNPHGGRAVADCWAGLGRFL